MRSAQNICRCGSNELRILVHHLDICLYAIPLVLTAPVVRVVRNTFSLSKRAVWKTGLSQENERWWQQPRRLYLLHVGTHMVILLLATRDKQRKYLAWTKPTSQSYRSQVIDWASDHAHSAPLTSTWPSVCASSVHTAAGPCAWPLFFCHESLTSLRHAHATANKIIQWHSTLPSTSGETTTKQYPQLFQKTMTLSLRMANVDKCTKQIQQELFNTNGSDLCNVRRTKNAFV